VLPFYNTCFKFATGYRYPSRAKRGQFPAAQRRVTFMQHYYMLCLLFFLIPAPPPLIIPDPLTFVKHYIAYNNKKKDCVAIKQHSLSGDISLTRETR